MSNINTINLTDLQDNLSATKQALRMGDLAALEELYQNKRIQMPQSILCVIDNMHTHLYKWLEDHGYPFYYDGNHYFLRIKKDNTTETHYVCRNHDHDGNKWIPTDKNYYFVKITFIISFFFNNSSIK